jgi:hypothetical protein
MCNLRKKHAREFFIKDFQMSVPDIKPFRYDTSIGQKIALLIVFLYQDFYVQELTVVNRNFSNNKF